MELTIEKSVELPQREAFAAATNLEEVMRVSGMPGAEFETVERGGRRVPRATATMLGMVELTYYDAEVEWVAPHNFTMKRIFERGPFRSVWIRIGAVAKSPTRTDLTIRVEIEARGGMGAIAARMMMGPKLKAGFTGLLESVEEGRAAAEANDERPPAFGSRVSYDSGELQERHTSALEFPRASERVLEVLASVVRRAPDTEVRHLDLITLAADHGFETFDVIRTACYATRAGMLRLRWDVRCPNCRQVAESHAQLGELGEGVHCEMCNLDFSAGFEESVEAVFFPHEAIRPVDTSEYCPVGPRYQPTREAQVILAPGAGRTITVQLNPGLYVRRPEERDAGRREILVNAAATERTQTVRYELTEDPLAHTPVDVAPGPVSIRLRNETASTGGIILERYGAHHTWISAAVITALPEFRDLFADQILAPGVRLGVQHAAFLFTDLKGSTAMYEKLGDARAFALVRQHFSMVEKLIREHDGGVVKHIGDAVMAVFARPQDALRAAVALRNAISGFNAETGAGHELILKIGVHAGPCLAVTLNGKLDYFGTTVNVAARVQNESRGGDVVFTRRFLELPEVADYLARARSSTATYRTKLKGLDGPFELVRLQTNRVRIDDLASRDAG